MSGKNKVAKHWATFPKFTDKELVGIASRGKSIFDYSDDERNRQLDIGRFVVCWDGSTQPEHADLKLGTLCGLTRHRYAKMDVSVRLENGETFHCGNAVVVDDEDSLPYVVGAPKPGTFDGFRVVGRLIGFVENYDGGVYAYLRTVDNGSVIYMKKECLAFVSDVKFGL